MLADFKFLISLTICHCMSVMHPGRYLIRRKPAAAKSPTNNACLRIDELQMIADHAIDGSALKYAKV